LGQQRERQVELSPQHFERFGERIDFCGMREIKESRGFLTRNAQCAGNIGGLNLKLRGDDPSIGVYLTPTTEGAAPMKAPVVIANSPSQVIVQMPTLADGQYTVSLTTQYSAGSRNIKEPRTYTFPILLTVGEGGGDSESPDEI